MVCTFFGHRDAPIEIKEALSLAISNLIENEGVRIFFVGNEGNFDKIARTILKEKKKEYSFIKYSVVLAYLPGNNYDFENCRDTIYPEGLERVPHRFAILERNKRMIKKSDFVITYVTNNFGGSSIAKEFAEKKGKRVIEIS